MLYVPQPKIENIWIPLGFLPHAASMTAKNMLGFLKDIKAGRGSGNAASRAARAVVLQFRKNLTEMGLARRCTSFNAVREDNSVYDVIHARE